MDVQSFLELCKKKGYEEKSIDKFKEAIAFAKEHLIDEKRLSGDNFFDHNLRVGVILVENRTEPEIVIAGILHGLLKDENNEEIEKKFGSETIKLLEEIGALKELKLRHPTLGAEALRKILLTTLKDIRVVLIKLANKLDNIQTMGIFPPEEQKRLAEEVITFYAPLAYRLGVENLRVRLEDLALNTLKPRKYQEIQKFLEESREDREKNIENAISIIGDLVKNKVKIVKIKGRPKHIYSIYKKITKRGVKLHEQFDLLGIRIIVPEIKDCYNLLGLLHEKFEPVEERLKDYIANPKPNFYRSIHTGVKLLHGKIAEIQIRTPKMDEFAEEGLAAHWKYKSAGHDQLFEKKIAWLRGILDLQRGMENKEFLETVKVDIFGDKMYCYTPKGDVKELPSESTLLDFAFLVHEEVGSHAIGGRVNGKFVPIKKKLNPGDIVEILTNKKQRPRRSWIKIVTSAKARQKIRKSLKEFEKLPAIYFRSIKPAIREEQGVLVNSEEFPKAVCVLAKCCHAIPGEEIVGIPTKRRVISVHKDDCKFVLKEEKRWVSVNWRNEFNQKIKFYVVAEERSGLLADLLHTIARAGFEVKEAKAKLLGLDEECSFLVIPRDLEHLQELIKRIRKVKGVKRIHFE